MATSSQCSVGLALGQKCQLNTWTKQIGCINMNELSDNDQLLIELRSALTNLVDICYHHKETILKKYGIKEKKCCDPCHIHKKPCRGKACIVVVFLTY